MNTRLLIVTYYYYYYYYYYIVIIIIQFICGYQHDFPIQTLITCVCVQRVEF